MNAFIWVIGITLLACFGIVIFGHYAGLPSWTWPWLGAATGWTIGWTIGKHRKRKER